MWPPAGPSAFLPGETNRQQPSRWCYLTAGCRDIRSRTRISTATLSVNRLHANINRSDGPRAPVITEIRIEVANTVDVAASSFHHVAKPYLYHNLEKDRRFHDGQSWTPVSGATNIAGTGGTRHGPRRRSGCVSGQFYRSATHPIAFRAPSDSVAARRRKPPRLARRRVSPARGA